MEEILVTIYCLAYNHEKYIRDALEGFLNQKTNFKYEVIVHDDASTDGTANIIREYEDKYPDIIKGIYQKENQYKKNISIFNTYILPNVKGKYLASCEGDDYWIDNLKLQKQVDYLEEHPECTFCFTNANIENQIDKKMRKFIPYTKEDSKYFDDTSKIYTLKNFHEIEFAPTASYIYPVSNISREPEYFKQQCPSNDLKRRLYYTAMGYAYYINDITCVYRENVPNSATTVWKSQNKLQKFEKAKKILDMIENVDMYTKYEYTDYLYKLKEKYILILLGASKNFKIFEIKEYYNVFRKQKLSSKIKIIMKIFLPDSIMKVLKVVKYKVKKI